MHHTVRTNDLETVIDGVVQSYDGPSEINNLESAALPNKRAVVEAYNHIKPVISTRKNQPREKRFPKASYRRRNIIERAIGWFKECRRLGTRFEKLAVNYVAFWMVAMIEKLLGHK